MQGVSLPDAICLSVWMMFEEPFPAEMGPVAVMSATCVHRTTTNIIQNRGPYEQCNRNI